MLSPRQGCVEQLKFDVVQSDIFAQRPQDPHCYERLLRQKK